LEKEILDSWKEIAVYLNRSVRTCQRFERKLGLPIHRIDDSHRARVFAYKEEIDHWLEKTQHSEKQAIIGKSSLKKLFFPIFAVLAIIVAALIIWQLLPEKKPYLAPKIENSIAVISFENQTGDEAYDYLQKAIPNLLITNLENTGFFHVATWERMHDLLKQIGKEDVEVIDRDLGFELCRREGIESIVLGSFTKAGEVFATDMKVLDVESKKLLKSASTKGKEVDSILLNQIDELSSQISLGIGVTKEKIESTQYKIAEVTTTSVEAYEYYLEGRDEQYKYNANEAKQLFEKAIALDPTFAMAHLMLAWVSGALGDIPVWVEAIKNAKAYSVRATEKERLFIEAFYTWGVEQDLEKGEGLLRELAQKYPYEKEAHYWLGQIYFMFKEKKMFIEALEAYSRVVELDPYYGFAIGNIGLIYAEMGNHDRAMEYMERWASVAPPDNVLPMVGIADIFVSLGKLEEAIAKNKEVLEIKPDFYYAYQKIGYLYALMEEYKESMDWNDHYIEKAPTPSVRANGYCWRAFYHFWLGAFDKCLEPLKKAEDVDKGNPRPKSVKEFILGWVYYEKGELEESKAQFKKWYDFCQKNLLIRNPSEVYYNYSLGLIDFRQGKIDSAKSSLSKLDSLSLEIEDANNKAFLAFCSKLLEGEVLLAEHLPDKALPLLEKATLSENLGTFYQENVHLIFMNFPSTKDGIARAYIQKGDIDKAIAEYEQLIHFGADEKEHFLAHPKYHYRLAILYEQTGQKAKAIEHYQKFLELWKDADPGIAEVEDARKRLAGLKVE
jgi:tetratricopeptide (TPR) repeat protein